MEGAGKRAPKAIVVGGSIAGLSCAHALIGAGWDVTVIEKTMSAPTGSPSGAGLSLEPQAIEVVNRWLGDPSILQDIAFSVATVVHQTYDKEKKAIQMLRRDSSDDFISHRSVHWTDLHSVIRRALPSDVVLWGHRFLSLRTSDGGGSVRVETKNLRTDETVEFEGDLLVAADGSMSAIRQHFLPNHKMRYSGYSAWRGVFDYSDAEKVDAVTGIRRAYPELGNCLYFDYADGNHCVFFQINSDRLNWLWYFNTPESGREGTSVTKKVDEEMIKEMHEEARRIWNPELAELMRQTKAPFINLIYDSDPLPRLVWDNVVLVGDAAHPTTPHASKSTNISGRGRRACRRPWRSTRRCGSPSCRASSCRRGRWGGSSRACPSPTARRSAPTKPPPTSAIGSRSGPFLRTSPSLLPSDFMCISVLARLRNFRSFAYEK
ncbi:uncharacterized protein M6B38_182940 [Iris pallida]|uniref:FAD-binding domain-containing protein n=1 Tax=Iris pallida TaxID=29817 RepID=A0AAX6EKB5_IRIPA|nr:uncharacterized protein M6B38_182940 [Iris pallida]